MTTIFEKANAALEVLDVPFAMNTYLGDLPDLYLVYQLIDAPSRQHADDEETLRSFRVQVAAYSKDGLTNLPDVDGAMLQAGFKKGPMQELPYSIETGHFGLAQDYIYLMTSEEMSQQEGAYS